MTKRIYFHIDEVARDSVVAANLKMVLASRGVELVYGNRWMSHILRRSCPFDAIILPALMFIESYLPIPTEPMPPLIVLPTEGIGGIPENPQRAALKFLGQPFMHGEPRWAEKVSAYCLWGEQQRVGFSTYAPYLLDRCHVIGHPRFDRRCLTNPQSVPKLADHRIKIGLMTRFSTINPFDRRSNLTSLHGMRKVSYHHFQQENADFDAEDMIYTQSCDMRVLFDIIDRIDPSLHDVSLRVHPREDRGRWQEMIDQHKLPVTMAPWDQQFAHWLEAIDWVVSPPSTGFYDCFVARKPVICIDAIQPRRRIHVPPISDDNSRILDFVTRPTSLDEIFALLASRPGEPTPIPLEVERLLIHDAAYPDCEQSLDRLADVCMDTLKHCQGDTYRSWGSWEEFSALADQLAQELAQHPIYKVEQGSTFRIDAERRAWIDGLAASAA